MLYKEYILSSDSTQRNTSERASERARLTDERRFERQVRLSAQRARRALCEPVALHSFTCYTHGGAMSAALLAYKMSTDVLTTHLTLSRYICEEGERSSATRL